MNDKKQSEEWKIALVHFLIAYIITIILAYLIMSVASFLLVILGDTIFVKLNIAVSYVVSILSVWLGVRTAASYICRKYLIKNADKITKLATLYYAIIVFGWSLLILESTLESLNYNLIVYQWVVPIIELIVFYVAGKKYIKNEDTLIAQQ